MSVFSANSTVSQGSNKPTTSSTGAIFASPSTRDDSARQAEIYVYRSNWPWGKFAIYVVKGSSLYLD